MVVIRKSGSFGTRPRSIRPVQRTDLPSLSIVVRRALTCNNVQPAYDIYQNLLTLRFIAMAPRSRSTPRLQVLTLTPTPFYSSLSSSTSDLNTPPSPLSARALYAESFDRPISSRSLPTNRYRKNMKEITGFTTTEEEFDALPIAVRRKVRASSIAPFLLHRIVVILCDIFLFPDLSFLCALLSRLSTSGIGAALLLEH
jgi:hypothetical protein